jgi:hypothetical protein
MKRGVAAYRRAGAPSTGEKMENSIEVLIGMTVLGLTAVVAFVVYR